MVVCCVVVVFVCCIIFSVVYNVLVFLGVFWVVVRWLINGFNVVWIFSNLMRKLGFSLCISVLIIVGWVSFLGLWIILLLLCCILIRFICCSCVRFWCSEVWLILSCFVRFCLGGRVEFGGKMLLRMVLVIVVVICLFICC